MVRAIWATLLVPQVSGAPQVSGVQSSRGLYTEMVHPQAVNHFGIYYKPSVAE